MELYDTNRYTPDSFERIYPYGQKLGVSAPHAQFTALELLGYPVEIRNAPTELVEARIEKYGIDEGLVGKVDYFQPIATEPDFAGYIEDSDLPGDLFRLPDEVSGHPNILTGHPMQLTAKVEFGHFYTVGATLSELERAPDRRDLVARSMHTVVDPVGLYSRAYVSALDQHVAIMTEHPDYHDERPPEPHEILRSDILRARGVTGYHQEIGTGLAIDYYQKVTDTFPEFASFRRGHTRVDDSY